MRTGEEIGAWPLATTDERIAIVRNLRERRRLRGRTSVQDQSWRRRRQS
ncbi:MAG: hypothetical protein AAFY56_10960 [Pseudomonadota bacterium]